LENYEIRLTMHGPMYIKKNYSCLVHHGSRDGDELTGPDVHWSLLKHHRTAALQAILNFHPPDTLSPPPHTHTGAQPRKRHLTNRGAYFAATVVKRAFLSAAWPSSEPKLYMWGGGGEQPFWCSQHLGYKRVGDIKVKPKNSVDCNDRQWYGWPGLNSRHSWAALLASLSDPERRISYPAGPGCQPIIQNQSEGLPISLHVKNKTVTLPRTFWRN